MGNILGIITRLWQLIEGELLKNNLFFIIPVFQFENFTWVWLQMNIFFIHIFEIIFS
jgi:hypothetical protein